MFMLVPMRVLMPRPLLRRLPTSSVVRSVEGHMAASLARKGVKQELRAWVEEVLSGRWVPGWVGKWRQEGSWQRSKVAGHHLASLPSAGPPLALLCGRRHMMREGSISLPPAARAACHQLAACR